MAAKITAPEMRDGAASPVAREDGSYAGTVTREAHPDGGWTFRAVGPYGNFTHAGFRTPGDAAAVLVCRDDNGHRVGTVRVADQTAGDAPTLTTKIYDRTACQSMIVLGTYPNGMGVYFRYESDKHDKVREVSRTRLRTLTKYAALCGHGYTANDSCPGCDADHGTRAGDIELYGTEVSEHIGQPVGQAHIELGMIYRHADCTWSALSPTGVVIGSNIVSADSAVRALRLDHKVRVWRTALNDNVLYDARKLDEKLSAIGITDRNRQQVEDAVSLLRACGIITGEQFERRLSALTEE